MKSLYTAKTKKRFLLLGGSGLIGSWLGEALASEGNEVLSVGRSPREALIPFSGGGSIRNIVSDYFSPSHNSSMLDDIDTVFHLLWTTVPVTSERDPARDIATNFEGCKRLARECVAHGVRRLFFFSSGGTVYGEPDELPLSEESRTNPRSAHGACKLAAERYLVSFASENPLQVVIIRPSNVYGRRELPNRLQGIVEVALSRALSRSTIQIWGYRDAVRDYIHASDVARALSLLSEKEALPSIFNVGSGVGHTTEEVLNLVSRAIGCPLKVEYTNKPAAFDLRRNVLDISKLKSCVDWQPQIELEQGIGSVLEQIRAAQPDNVIGL